MTNKLLFEDKIYELALEEKRHHETRRDDINNQYISLFSAIIAATPFIGNITSTMCGDYEEIIIKLAVITLSAIGLILSIIWSANLKRILYLLESIDEIIQDLEKKYNITYLTYIFQQLNKKQAPGRITKYQLMMPIMFIFIFALIASYSLFSLLKAI